MKTLAAIAVFAACGAPTGTVAPIAPPARGRVVLISIDGLMPETYLDPDRLGLRVPALRAMHANGAFARAVEGVFPSVTYPAHTTMVTGVPPGVHGITTNRPPDPAGKNQDGWRWYAEDIAVPPLWRLVPKAALITWPVTVGAEVAIRVPEYWRAGTAEDGKLLRALTTPPDLLARVEREHPALWAELAPPDVRDAAQFAIARHVIAQDDPDLVLMHVWMTDDAQHAHGPRSAEAKQAIEAVDALLGDLLATLAASPAWDKTLVMVVSDHGFAPVDHEINLDVLLAGKRAFSIANGGSAYVYAEDAAAREAALAVAKELGARVRVVLPEEIATLGGDPTAAFALVAAPDFAFGTKRTGPALVDVPGRGTHGYLPADANMVASFLAVGGRVRPRDLGTIRMIDIAPTAAHWLGVAMPSAIGAQLDIAR